MWPCVIFWVVKFNLKLIIPAAILILALLGAGGYMLYQNQQNQIKADPQKSAQDEVKKLVQEVGKLIELPTGEDPTVATVTDISKLKDQPFFQKAKNGDKVLIYTNARRAILYDPLVKRVIDVAPINIGTASAASLPKVALRNGTQTVGLTTTIENKLKKDNIAVNVSSKENAEKQNYQKSVVVVLNDSARDLAQAMAKDLGATVGDLPEGEIKPKDADIVIILGKDSTK